MDKHVLVKALGGSSIAFGVLAAARPALLLSAYRTTPNPEACGMARWWGTRNILLGALILRSTGQELDELLLSAAALNSADALLGFLGNALNGTTGPGPSLAGATSAAFAGVALSARNA